MRRTGNHIKQSKNMANQPITDLKNYPSVNTDYIKDCEPTHQKEVKTSGGNKKGENLLSHLLVKIKSTRTYS